MRKKGCMIQYCNCLSQTLYIAARPHRHPPVPQIVPDEAEVGGIHYNFTDSHWTEVCPSCTDVYPNIGLHAVSSYNNGSPLRQGHGLDFIPIPVPSSGGPPVTGLFLLAVTTQRHSHGHL